MAQPTVTLSVRIAWWVRPYLAGATLFAWTFGMQPDMDKVAGTVQRGVRVVVV
jgi:hypothetical protein